MVGRRNRRQRSRVSQMTDIMYGSLTLGSTTTWTRKNFPGLANMGDRPFQVISVKIVVSSASPMLYQARLYSPHDDDNVGSTGLQMSGTTPRTHRMRALPGQNTWFSGNTSSTQVIVAIDGLKTKTSDVTPQNAVAVQISYRVAPSELQSATGNAEMPVTTPFDLPEGYEYLADAWLPDRASTS
uniref:p20 protein n=1 Tax=Bamboo mosaic virus satellite RNA TaxID=190811 RepID=Q6XXP5_9VIRU|nr:P20 protein [Bamboo mosaic virus satellite RNA]BBA49563.1 P20 protein [Bamboo mosaic virus satellite RNA]BBA49593.1 P20 protein [Bamboo mosaic virus satellite RNA]BBA49631.1 P20 protein [Bamboo mosaic virus satellite RNA]BBA49641.1 P20 protein [Bamboo mosaic virus satellite RNA]